MQKHAIQLLTFARALRRAATVFANALSGTYDCLASGIPAAAPASQSAGCPVHVVNPVGDVDGSIDPNAAGIGRWVWDDESRGWVVKPAGVHNPADYRPFNLDQAAMQSAFRTQALADSKKRAAPFAWPARKGHSSEQCKRQALRSVERGILRANQGPRLPLAARPAELNRFNAIQVPELPDDLALGINPVGSRADENQFQGDWPWEPTASKTRSQAPPVPERTSRYVRQHHPLDDHIEMYLDQASADGKRGRSTTGVRAWFAFCQDVVGTPADRPIDPFITPLFDKLEDEWLAMRFVCALVSDRGVTPDTAAKYFSSVQGWHLREHGVKLAGGMKLERIPQMVKGMKRVLGSIPKKLRRGVAPQALQKAMDLVLDPKNPSHANIRAALACALQGLLRSCEYTSKDGKANRFTINRSDIAELTKDRLVFWMHPGKNMNHIGGKTCPLVIGAGGEYVDAVAEVRNLLEVDPVDSRDAHLTPLFRDPLTNTPIRYDTINHAIKSLMSTIGENPAEFSTHSMRIGGATALFAAGANETVIRTMGRWSSDMHRLYVRACFEQCCEWTRRAGTQSVSDLAGMSFDEVDDY